LAYSSAPEKQTYSTDLVPAAYDMDLRPDSTYFSGATTYQDAGMINLLPMKGKNPITRQDEIHAVTRQPIHAYEVVNSDLINRGCYVWEKSVGTTYYFSVNGTGVYSSTDGITWALVNTLLTSATTPVRFTEFIDGVNTKSLVLVDGVEGYVYTTNAAGTKITDADFPTPHVPFPVYLDGYLFLAKVGTGDIYNSNLYSPSAWTAGDFISSELYPDDIQALVKVNNYLLVIGTQGSEFFYDAANPTASPLARYDGGSLPFGTQVPNSIASNKNTVVMIANNNDGENTIKVIEDFKQTDIDPSFLISALNSRLSAASNPTTAAAVRGYFFRQGGKLFYGLAFQGSASSPSLLNATFAFSFDTGWWCELRMGATGAAPFPVYSTAMSRSGKIATYVSGHVGGTPFFGQMEEGGETPFAATAVDHIVNGPASSAIYTEVRTPNITNGTRNVKTMSRFGVDVTDNSSATATSGATVSINVSWSDDDYATFNTPVSLIYGATLNFPFITQLGMYRQRAFKLTYASTLFLRYKGLEMDINKGQQ
jgi:hypothetical protein